MRTGIVIAMVTIVTVGAAAAAEVAEVERSWERAFAPGDALRIENLVGSITVDGASDPGVVRVRARVVAEADDAEAARALAEAVDLEVVDGDPGPTLRPTWPVDRITAFRVPASETGGFVSRVTSWVGSKIRKQTVATEWDGRAVEVGSAKGATPLAVHLHVSLPLDTVTELRQVVGTLDVARLRGDTTLEIVEGQAEAMQLYGTLRVRTGGGDVGIKTFKGDTLVVETSSGPVEVVDARVDRADIRTGAGPVRIESAQAESLGVRSASGDVLLVAVESRALDVRSEQGEVDVATRLKRTREATIVSGGDVVLRVGEVTPFDLVATTRKGGVDAKGIDLEPIARADDGLPRWRRGHGGVDVRVEALRGSLTVRAIR